MFQGLVTNDLEAVIFLTLVRLTLVSSLFKALGTSSTFEYDLYSALCGDILFGMENLAPLFCNGIAGFLY